MTKKVLIADDEEDLRNLVKSYLKEYDLEIIEASDGEEAVEFAKKYKPDMIITDNNMPGLTGYEVLQKLKRDVETRNIPIVMVVGKKFKQEMQMLIKFDAKDFIQKPYEEDKIVALVKKVLGDIKKKSEVDTVSQSDLPQLLVEKNYVFDEKQVLKQDMDNNINQVEQHPVVEKDSVEQVVELPEPPEPEIETKISEQPLVQQETSQYSQPLQSEQEDQKVSVNTIEGEEKIAIEQSSDAVEEKNSVIDLPGYKIGQTIAVDTPIPSVDNTQSLEDEKLEDEKLKQVSEKQDDLQAKGFVEQEKVNNQVSDSIILPEQEKNFLETNFVNQEEHQEISKQNLETTLLPPDFSDAAKVPNKISQEIVEENTSLQSSQQEVLQKNNEDKITEAQIAETLVAEKMEPVVVEKQDKEHFKEQEKFSDQKLQEPKETEKIVLENSKEQKIFKPEDTEVEKVSISKISQNLRSVLEEKITETETEEKLNVLDEGIYLVNKLVATSVLETLFPQKKVKPTLESKAIVLIIENVVSKETLSKLNQIIETIPLMKVMINQELFNEKVSKIKKFLKKVSKEEVIMLADTLSKFFKK